MLRSAGFKDIFALIKEQENQKALELLPAVLRCAEPSSFLKIVIAVNSCSFVPTSTV